MANQRQKPDSLDYESLTQFVSSTEFQDIPDPVIETAKRIIIDEVGVALAGVGSDAGNAVTEMISDVYSETSAGVPVLGTSEYVSVPDAALANATVGHAQDFNNAAL
jgi:2-methylcitrate dehydratase PrpD